MKCLPGCVECDYSEAKCDHMIDTISIRRDQLEALYWGESGTPEDWHSEEEISDVLGCAVEAIDKALAEHKIAIKTDINLLHQAIWEFLIEWGLSPEYNTKANFRPVHFAIAHPDGDSLAFWVHETLAGKPKVILCGEWTVVELPTQDTSESDVLRFVEEMLIEFEYKRADKRSDAPDIDW